MPNVMTDGMMKSQTVEWEAPQALFDQLDAEFHFTVDVASTDENAKCTKHYTKAQDGLKQTWGGDSMVQSTLWNRDSCLRKEGVRKQMYYRYASSCPYRYKVVSRLYLRQSRNTLFAWTIEIWQRRKFCAVSFNGCCVRVR